MMGMLRKLWWVLGITAVFLILFPYHTTAQEEPTPTVDRLAAPPTVPSPNQADEGAQLFWLYCQPCHGDQGQGLTDEWRSQFPEEDQNCWKSGCHGTHGKDAPEFGFELPTAVPAVIGAGSLTKFETLAQLNQYISIKMPLELPGRLTEEEYLAITAFIARAHGFDDSETLTFEKMGEMRLRPAATPTATAVPTPQPTANSPITSAPFTFLATSFVLIVVSVGGMWLWHQRQS